MSFIAAVTLQMALIGTVGIFRPISIGFQGEHTSNGFKFSGIGIGQFATGLVKSLSQGSQTPPREERVADRLSLILMWSSCLIT